MNNAFLIRWLGGWAERTDDTSIADVGRIESLLGLGAQNSLDEAYRVADAQLAEFARHRTQTDVAILPVDDTDTPYVAFNVGDTVTVESVSHRVLGLTVDEDQDTGRPIYIPTLNDDVVLEADERVMQAIRKMIPGTGGGRYKVAQPIIPAYTPRSLAPLPAGPAVKWLDFDATIAASLHDTTGRTNSWDNQTPTVIPTTPTLNKITTGPLDAQSINGRNALLFDSAGNMELSSSPTLAQPLTFYVVCQPTATNTHRALFQSGSGTEFGVYNNDLYLYCGTLHQLFTGTFTTTSPHLVTVVMDGANSKLRVGNGAFDTGNAGTRGLSGASVFGAFSDNWWTGNIGRILAYRGVPNVVVDAAVCSTLYTEFGL